MIEGNGNIDRKLPSLLSEVEDSRFCIILSTAPNNTFAHATAKRLLAENLAACVTLLPCITSFYCWQGAIEQQAEVQMIIKSRMALYKAVFANIKAYHPYQIPELLVLPVISGDNDYLSWLRDTLR